MDLITLGIGITGIAAIPLGAITKVVWDYGPRLTVLETNYKNLDQKLTEMRTEQRDQTQKLDRIVERVL